ncbi:heterokaryon incompatibility protein-domain-containing protein [Diaporthe sp. PMI_573]|nr:heterokaryon incompatibility protein-domain-containing protein [Diaporthaceae sp. PMI_573]
MEENEDAVLVAHDNQDRAIDENNDAEFDDDDEEDEDSQSSELGTDNSQPSDEAKSLSPEMYSALTGDKALSRFIPTRLIEVRTHGGAPPNTTARLCEAKDLPKDAPYLTLSHCWGGNTMFMLTNSNLGTLKQDIPVHQLSDLFKDALYMTSQLGMRYIWIDCLCILQDCQRDWAYEAAQMGDIYRYAKCNIAASGYKDGKTSLFKERTPLPLLNFPLDLDLVLFGDKETVGQDVRTTFKGIYVRAKQEEFYDSITKGLLNSRGWVAQERALSPGILHFTPKQMWWECKSRIASESFPDISLQWSFAQKDDGPDALRTLSAETNIDDVYKSWNDFVQFYAETDLTVESDRFPALTGIAHAFRELTEDNLIAGLWERDLIRSLAWTVFSGDRAKKIPSEPLAPSWSWAFLCIPHTSTFCDRDDHACLSVCRRILSDDPDFRSDLQYTSIIKSSVWGLAITGPLRKLPVRIKRLSKLSKWRDYVMRFDVRYDVADSRFFSAEDIARESWHWEETRHILPLIQNDGLHATCLLLNEAQGAEHPNTFRRLGVVEIWFKDEDSCEKTLGIGRENQKSKPSIFFEVCGLHDLILI